MDNKVKSSSKLLKEKVGGEDTPILTPGWMARYEGRGLAGEAKTVKHTHFLQLLEEYVRWEITPILQPGWIAREDRRGLEQRVGTKVNYMVPPHLVSHRAWNVVTTLL